MPGGPITGPDAWRADEMRERDDWVHVLSESEIAEIDAAVDAVDTPERPIAGHRPGRLQSAGARSGPRGNPRGLGARPRLRAHPGAARRALLGTAARDRVLGNRRLVGPGRIAECNGASAGPRHRPRPDERRLSRPHLPDPGSPVLSRRLLRHRRPALRAQGKDGGPERHRELGDPLQRDVRAFAGADCGAVPAASFRSTGRGAGRQASLVRDAGVQLVRRQTQHTTTSGATSSQSAACPRCRRSRSVRSRPSICSTRSPRIRASSSAWNSSRGDIQFLHNPQILHDRTAFEDESDAAECRHLLRLWLCAWDGRPLPAAYAGRWGQRGDRPSRRHRGQGSHRPCAAGALAGTTRMSPGATLQGAPAPTSDRHREKASQASRGYSTRPCRGLDVHEPTHDEPDR